MSSVREYIEIYVRQARTMQVATIHGNQPWIATVYFVMDDKLNLYWLSLPSRRHSQDIAIHDQTAIALAIKTDLPVIGLQAQGMTTQVDDEHVIKRIMPVYIAKYNTGQYFYERFRQGNAQHALYCFKPEEFVLFDEEHFLADPRQIYKLESK